MNPLYDLLRMRLMDQIVMVGLHGISFYLHDYFDLSES